MSTDEFDPLAGFRLINDPLWLLILKSALPTKLDAVPESPSHPTIISLTQIDCSVYNGAAELVFNQPDLYV